MIVPVSRRLRALLFLLGTGAAASVCAEVSLDGSLGPAGALPGPEFVIPHTAGTQTGNNLFHSFSAFNLSAGESAEFTGPAGIAHVLGRVTGGSPSTIDGLLRSSLPDAQVYLINPAGILFGPNAALDVPGSFHASSADYVRLADGTRYTALPSPADALLTSAPPAAFGFLGQVTPGDITVDGAQLITADGATLSLVGGGVSLSGGAYLGVPDGRVQLVSRAAPGEVALAPDAPDDLIVGELSEVNLSDFSVIETTGGDGGEIRIRSGRLTLDSSYLVAENFGPGDGGVIDIRTDIYDQLNGSQLLAETFADGLSGLISIQGGNVTLSGENEFNGTAIYTQPLPGSTGAGNDLVIAAAELTLANGAELRTQTQGAGASGNILLNVDGDLRLMGEDSFGKSSLISSSNFFTTTEPSATGGTIRIQTGNLLVLDGGIISGGANGPGRGGNISIDARGLVLVAGENRFKDVSGDFPSRISLDSTAANSGAVGTLVIRAAELRIEQGGLITSNTKGSGNGGLIDIDLSGDLSLSGNDAEGLGGRIEAVADGAGAGGSIRIQAANLRLLDGARISAFSNAAGDGGDVDIAIDGQIRLAGAERTADAAGSVLVTQAQGQANAGILRVAANELLIEDGGGLFADTFGPGLGGDIDVTVAGTLRLSGNAADGRGSAIATTVDPAASGRAGNIAIHAGAIVLLDGGQINSSTGGSGAAGDITVTADSISILAADRSARRIGSGIVAETDGSGDGGSLRIQTRVLSIGEQGQVSTLSSGSGAAGDISIAADRIELERGIVATSAADADGGNIDIQAQDLLLLRDASITTSVGTGQSSGGNIRIDPIFVILDRGRIQANAFGGSGGNIDIVAQQFIASPDSLVEAVAKAPTGVDGRVVIDSPDQDLSGDITAIDIDLTQGASMLLGSCANRDPEAQDIRLLLSPFDILPDTPYGLRVHYPNGAAQDASKIRSPSNTALLTGDISCAGFHPGSGNTRRGSSHPE